MDNDSMWLQKSVNLSDSIDDIPMVEPAPTSMPTPMSTAMLTPLPSKPSAFVETMLPPTRLSGGARSAGLRQSSSRLSSLANVMGSFPSAFEVDELKSKLAQLQREKLKWDDSCRELERLKAELKQAQDDYRSLDEYTLNIKQISDETAKRAERDSKTRQEAEAKLLESMRASAKEIQQAKALADEVRKERAHAEYELRVKLDAEHQQAISGITSEHEAAMGALESRIRELEGLVASVTNQLSVSQQEVLSLKTEIEALSAKRTQDISMLAQREEELTHQLQRQAMLHQNATEDMKSDHAREIEALRARAANDLQRAREEMKHISECAAARYAELETRFEKLKDDLFVAKAANQEKELALTKERVNHELFLEKERDLHRSAMSQASDSHREEKETLLRKLSSSEASLRTSESNRHDLQDKLVNTTSKLREMEQTVQVRDAEIRTLNEKMESAISDIDVRDADIEELTQLVHRMHADKDTEVSATMQDLQEARARALKAEEELASARLQLSSERKAHMVADGAQRKTITELQERLNDLCSRNVTAHTEDIECRKSLEHTCNQLLARTEMLSLEKSQVETLCDTMKQEVAALQARLATMEEENRHLTAKRERALSSATVNRNSGPRDTSTKRCRSESGTRVFAISGFDGAELQSVKIALHALPNTKLIECKSNQSVPDGVTHLIASGTLTIKLLTAAAKGCWIVPKAYIDECLTAGSWLPERGFKHTTPPLQGKSVYFTAQFRSKRHFENAKILIEQGGGKNVDQAASADIILGLNSEPMGDSRTTTWERLVHDVYPLLA